jgi:hypothetical protein
MAPTGKSLNIYRYPVKSLTPEPLLQVRLSAGQTLPADRSFAIENGPIGFDQPTPKGCRKPVFCRCSGVTVSPSA